MKSILPFAGCTELHRHCKKMQCQRSFLRGKPNTARRVGDRLKKTRGISPAGRVV